ncbi:ribosome biogenesis protein ytm1 [Malassezia nana]|uniref:Ribosome biogenesis protein ytm1 n=1 Tax=Malassezia nana TaxID=180528 RepID=A0AAF0EJ53_9BASI|nr:ribosome biogenesis protein ytm1 [Malassezia nana]
MASQDVTQFLSSVGSELVECSDDVVKKRLPASAVAQLLDAHIETLSAKAPPPPASEAVEDGHMAEDFITDELHDALEAYSDATTRYTHTSMVASVVSEVIGALQHVVALQQAIEKEDKDVVARLCANAESEVAKIGIQANFQQGVVALKADAPLAQYACMDLLVNLCHTLANRLTEAEDVHNSSGLEIESTEDRIELKTVPQHPGRRLPPFRSSEPVAPWTRPFLEQVIEPVLTSGLRWTAVPTENGVLLERTASTASLKTGACIPEIKAILTAIQPLLPEEPEQRATLLRHCIPPMMDLMKTHLTSCLPSVLSSEELEKSTGWLVERAMELHRHLVQLRFVSDPALPRTRLSPQAPAPLSDLPAWTKSVPAIGKQHMVGAMLAHVRSTILDMHDRLWDPILQQAPMASNVPVPLQPAPDKPAVRTATQAPPAPAPPVSTPTKAPSQGKKPTLGVVKRGARLPDIQTTTQSSSVSQQKDPEDDWGWGDEDETESAPQDTSKKATGKDELDDDWGWGDDDAEVEQMLTQTTEQPSAADPAPDAGSDALETSLDAWNWNDDEAEEEEESQLYTTSSMATPPAVTKATASMAPQLQATYAVSQRILEIHEAFNTQWSRLNKDVPLRPWIAQGLVEMIQLYRGLMPVVHGPVLQQVPLLGMLFVNDCTYMALTLREYASQASQWGAFRLPSRQTLEASLRAEADWLDDMSTQWGQSLCAFQAHSLHECLDQADGFARTDNNARYEACERAIVQIQHLLAHLVNVWRPVMTRESMIEALCELVDGLFARTMQEIEDLQDISEPESMRLAKLCHKLLEAATSVLDGAETQVPTYFKFAYLPDILQGSMADLEYLLFGNESGSALCDYSREEMAMLVRALFADTPGRRRLLDGIQRWNGSGPV